jgi:hypothetical protein
MQLIRGTTAVQDYTRGLSESSERNRQVHLLSSSTHRHDHVILILDLTNLSHP